MTFVHEERRKMRLIDADVLERMWEIDTALNQLREIGKDLCRKMDDVQKIRHGHWAVITKDDSDAWCVIKCTNCGFFDPYPSSRKEIEEDGINYNYCPNCGALMDEVEE